MKIAILGTRGIPANYGGFETFAEELSTRLAIRGHDVTVYCRSHHAPAGKTEHKDVRLRVFPTIRHKYLDTVAHTFLSAIDAAFKRFDIVLLCNAANSPFIPILTWTGTPVVVNVDGLERNRKKWSAIGKLYYKLGERTSVWFATRVVTDAAAIRDYYREQYDLDTSLIVYGADIGRSPAPEVISRYGVEPEGSILYLSRLEPENNAAMVIEGFRASETDAKLLVVGDAPYADEYKRELRRLAAGDDRIIFTGYVYGDDRKALQQNALVYVHATEVGGTHPALLEAMGAANCVLYLKTPENTEVTDGTGIAYTGVADLTAKLDTALNDTGLRKRLAHLAAARVSKHYDWECVSDSYERLFHEVIAK